MSQQLQPPAFNSVGKVLYLSEELKDLTVIVHTETSQWKFPAHKLILSTESPVLRSKLEEDESLSEIVLDDITPSTAEALMRYMYCGELEIDYQLKGIGNWNEGVRLLEAAFKFEIEDLVQKCGRFLEDIISLTNVCYIYDKASACSLPVLQDKCLKLILDAGFVILRSSAFEILNKDCVMDIVSSSDLNVDSELVVFETLFRWARIECCRTGLPITESNILTQIKPFLQHVCIDDMSDAEKSALPATILACVKPNNRNRIGFSVLPSLLPYSHHLDFEMNQNCLDFIGDNLTCLRFSVDRPVHLLGLHVCFTANMMPLTLPLKLTKESTPKKATLCFNLCAVSTTIHSSTINQRVWHKIELLFRHPVLIKAGDVYNISLSDTSADALGTDAQCPRTISLNSLLHTPSGYINFNVYGEEMWGVTGLIVIT